MKILLIGDASNYHYTLGQGLKSLGHDVTVASSGMLWQDTERDINLRRGNTRLSGAWLWARLNITLSRRLRGYDVVQIVNPIFVDLKPHRVAQIFHKLKRENGAIYLTALGTDYAFVKTCLSADNPLRFSEWQVEGRPTPFSNTAEARILRRWLENPLKNHAEMIYENVDGVISALYEYHVAMQRFFPDNMLAYGGIPINVDTIPFFANKIEIDRSKSDNDLSLDALLPFPKERKMEKGTEIIKSIFGEIPGLKITEVAGIKYTDFLDVLSRCNIVLDQYYAHTPATTALLAMAMGKLVVTGASKDFEKFIGEAVPALNINPLDTDTAAGFIKSLLTKDVDGINSVLVDFGQRGRDFVTRHNSAEVVARRFEDFWQRSRS